MDVLKKLADRLFEKRPDEDIVDRANNSATPFLLICCAIVVFAKEYGPVSEPMYCWTQAEFNDQWMEYIHDYCFVESTYYVPFNESVPVAGQRNNGNDRLNYYQWVPFILVAMALFSQFTHYFWNFCNMLSEKDLPSILRKICAAVYDEDEQLSTDIAEGIASHFHVVLLANSHCSTKMMTMDSKKGRNSDRHLLSNIFNKFRAIFARDCLAFVYLFTKLLYFMVNVVQFKFISIFLGVNNLPTWGWAMLDSFLTHGTSWEHNGHFPRVTLCDLKIRQPNERFHEFTVQCVLVANFLNEKIFLMLYFWFILMAIVSLFNLAQWFWILLFRSQNRYVNRLIELSLLQMHPDPEFDFGPMAQQYDDAADNRKDEGGTESGETEDGDETDSRKQRSRFTAIVSGPTAAKAENLCDDNHSGTSSNNSTATMKEMEEHSRAAHQQQCNSTISSSESGSTSMKADEEALLIEVQKKRNELYREFKMHKTKFMDLLGFDGILAAKMMCASAGLQMSSLVMGRLLCAFLRHHNKKDHQQVLPV